MCNVNDRTDNHVANGYGAGGAGGADAEAAEGYKKIDF